MSNSVVPPSVHLPLGGDFSSRDVLALFFRYWWVFLIVVALTVGASTFMLLVRPKVWVSSASFVPQANDSGRNRFAGLAGQLGISLGSGDPGRSPSFYVDLLQSRAVLGEAVSTRYRTALGERNLIEFFGVSGGDSALSFERAVDQLRGVVRAESSRETGVIRFRVTTPDPEMSYLVANRILELVNQFNLRSRQALAGAERQFIEQRIEDAAQALRTAEDRLLSFEQQNRGYESSPRLMAEWQRMRRGAEMRQQILSSLAQAFETARLDEVRSTPLIVPIELPVRAARPEPLRSVEKTLIALLAGLVLSVVVSFSLESWRKLRGGGTTSLSMAPSGAR
jgi:uncharacterized protein involved in exopolysaccharide biosynthesis